MNNKYLNYFLETLELIEPKIFFISFDSSNKPFQIKKKLTNFLNFFNFAFLIFNFGYNIIFQPVLNSRSGTSS